MAQEIGFTNPSPEQLKATQMVHSRCWGFAVLLTALSSRVSDLGKQAIDAYQQRFKSALSNGETRFIMLMSAALSGHRPVVDIRYRAVLPTTTPHSQRTTLVRFRSFLNASFRKSANAWL